MNTIHDMGGMDGFGPVEPEENEPVFHETWEGRMFALFAGGVLGPWRRGRNFPRFRWTLETIAPEEYLRMSYYERWYAALTNTLLGAGLVTERELETGYRDAERPLPTQLPATGGGGPTPPDPDPAFGAGDQVRARNLHPRGHTRLPRYARDKRGTIVTDNGIWRLQDTDENGQVLGNFPQHVYTVRFEGQELWGDRASPRDAVCMDLWEEYIEPA
ncbi:MAG: nitrile hydratase subunit beta [Acidobacteria bacterium]|nr:nitrile hydratase subunit beta [Acidobacteriota bacterium]